MIWLALYIGSVVAINYAFSAAPGLDLLWSCWAGLIFILRDMVQTRFGHGSLLAMAAACLLSYWLADPFVALASATAFAVSELIDWLVFTITRRPLRDRLWLSSAASIPVDTLIFFGMIGVWATPVLAASMTSKFAGVSVVWLTLLGRARRAARVG
jgi:uncharacterized PurR-regulated membrane protein YhhQ (DUF165 family)